MSLLERMKAATKNLAASTEIEIGFGIPPTPKIKMNGKILADAIRSSHLISHAVMMSFTDRPVFWSLISTIDPSTLEGDLRDREKEFETISREIREKAAPGSVHLSGYFDKCILIVARHRRELSNHPAASLQQAIEREVPKMRSEIVPYMEVIAQFVPDDYPPREDLIRAIAEARSTMTPELAEASRPVICTVG